MVFTVFDAVRYPPGQTGEFAVRAGKPKRARTPCGWFAGSGTAGCAVGATIAAVSASTFSLAFRVLPSARRACTSASWRCALARVWSKPRDCF